MSGGPTLYPSGYGTEMITEATLRGRHERYFHPDFFRPLMEWLRTQEGHIGIGGGWRPTGEQPDKPGFAPEGRSFHQTQLFASGMKAAAAVDLVATNGTILGIRRRHRSPTWAETESATRFGLHTFIRKPTADNPNPTGQEPWHIQPANIRGWTTWVNQGRPDPQPAPPAQTPDRVTIDTENPNMLLNFNTVPARVYDSGTAVDGNMYPGETRKIAVGMSNVAVVNVTAANTSSGGFLSVAGRDGAGNQTSVVNYDTDGVASGVWAGACPDGHIYVTATGGGCRVIVDVMVTGSTG